VGVSDQGKEEEGDARIAEVKGTDRFQLTKELRRQEKARFLEAEETTSKVRTRKPSASGDFLIFLERSAKSKRSQR